MKTCLRLAVTTVGAVLILIAMGAIAADFFVDTFVRARVEQALADAFETGFTLESVTVLPFAQTIAIEGLSVENPDRFKRGPAIEFGRVTIGFGVRQLLSGDTELKRILIEDTRVNLRYEVGRGTNIGRLARQAADHAETKGAGPRRDVVVQEFACDGARVRLSTNLVPFSAVNLRIARFTLDELGRRPVSPPEIAAVFLRSLLWETVTLKGLLSPLASRLKEEVQALQAITFGHGT